MNQDIHFSELLSGVGQARTMPYARHNYNLPAEGYMTMQEIQTALEKHYGKAINICLQTGDPMEFKTYIGETEMLLHVKVEVSLHQLTLGQADLAGWQMAYLKTFGKEAKCE
jgi:hypothetical protein